MMVLPKSAATRLFRLHQCFNVKRLLKLLLAVAALGLIAAITVELVFYWRTGRSSALDNMAATPFLLLTRPSIDLVQGRYLGKSTKGSTPQIIEEWLGIPYARSLAGEGRFAPPRKLEEGVGDYDATDWGDQCWGGSNQDGLQGDNCLVVNIFRPRGVAFPQKVPVVIYFHGGAFNFGSGRGRDMESFVGWSEEPIIGMSFNYRVGALGFLSGEWAGKNGLLNLGLKDQRAMLEWVQDNIEAFGGDKDQVTVMGLSAGAHAIGHHLMRTDVEPLFKRVIMESGGPTSRAVYPSNHKQHEQQWQEFLHLTGLFDTPDDQKLEKLRSLPVSSIVQASETIYHRYEGSLRWPWQPVIDGPGGMLPEAPIDAWKNRRYHKVNILTGFNTNEGTTFVNPYVESPADFTNFFRTLIPKFQEEDIDMLNQVYPDPAKDSTSIYKETRKGLGKQYKRLAAAYGDFAYIAPVRQTAYYASATGASDDADVYLYHFAVNSSVAHGASHGSNDPYVVNSPSARNIDELQKGIAIHMHAFWTSFVISGNPNDVRKGPAANRMVWGQYGKRGSSAKIVFGEGSEEIAHKGPLVGSVERMKADLWEAEESKFWWARVGLVES